MDNKSLFSTNDAADYLGISVAALKYHVYAGKNIEPTKIGHSLVFTKEQLDEFNRTKRDPGRPAKKEE